MPNTAVFVRRAEGEEVAPTAAASGKVDDMESASTPGTGEDQVRGERGSPITGMI